ncbi:MAG TPA: malto-oligosyltrehalose trehalohydrolase [Lacunisphaera sp.]|jgi:maltooligosyltrehalose trehalohydrolase
MNLADSLPGVSRPSVGAQVSPEGVNYRVWAPGQSELSVLIESSIPQRLLSMAAEPNGYWSVTDPAGRAGDRYRFFFPNRRLRPDPASRFQPEGVHGPSACIDPSNFQWRCGSWTRPAWRGQSIYEIHVGTFTNAGTYFAAIEKLNHVQELGVEAIELMPLADFAGDRNWGYDGVALYAPARCYGQPDDLRALVDAAHDRGLAVILDVVYNHLGPAGNYLADFSSGYFRTEESTPWGQGFAVDRKNSRPVRDFIVANAGYWLDEFRFDGVRLDATHAISDQSSPHLIEEITAAVHERGGFVIAEDERNLAQLAEPVERGGTGVDALWADDFHHEVRVALTRTRDSYFRAYRGTAAELADSIAHGWTYRGRPYEPWHRKLRGSACDHLSPASFVFCIENHDQVGNRANGERLEHLITHGQFRAASMLLCLSPYCPMLFMGQEWAATSPFLYFTDHGGELGANISVGRKKEFEQHGAQWTGGIFPDPESAETFEKSKLRWDERNEDDHARVLSWYQACLEQRRILLKGGPFERNRWRVESFGEFIAIRYFGRPCEHLLVVALRKTSASDDLPPALLAPPIGMEWREVLSTEDPRFGGKRSRKNSANTEWSFPGPGGVWLESTRKGPGHAAD